MSLRIEDYALIGDCRGAGLVGIDGSIDWLCIPRFDSGACFAKLLGTPEHGRWIIAPLQTPRAVKRRYIDGTLLLETDFDTDSGKVRITDFMTPHTDAPQVVRIVEGLRGQVQMHTDLTIRFDYGSVVPWVRRIHNGLRAVGGPDALHYYSSVALQGQGMHSVADFVVNEGQRIDFNLAWSSSFDPAPKSESAEKLLRHAQAWWEKWSGQCKYHGPWKQHVLRSLITLKALTFSKTGAIIAAPTTSLPEAIGGMRNWDYRYCWLRDATFSLYALTVGGYLEEAKAWRDWLLSAVAGTPADLQIMYGIFGERRIEEVELPWLTGYDNSKPVRIGNAAFKQHQLDVYGELMDSLYSSRRIGLAHNAEAWRVQQTLANFLGNEWEKPDKGIWEIRGPDRQFTYSKVMAWAAFDRAVKAVEELGEKGDATRWRRARDDVRREIMAGGYNSKQKAFTQYYGSSDADASLLMLPLVGFIDPKDPRMVGTVKLVEEQLLRDQLVLRYPPGSNIDGLPGGQGAFIICSFWLADNYALQGHTAKARQQFERLLELCNDVGLLSEEYDLGRKRLTGNFPQAFSHVGLINSARNQSHAGGPAEHRAAK